MSAFRSCILIRVALASWVFVVLSVATASAQDQDADGILDGADNCPADANAGQSDNDLDGVGNACDNCPYVGNAAQVDADNDDCGDPCDSDPASAGAPGAPCTVTCDALSYPGIDRDRACRAAISSGLSKLRKVADRKIAKCFKLLATHEIPLADCTLAVFDGADPNPKVQAAAAKFEAKVAQVCADTSNLARYVSCPAPCDNEPLVNEPIANAQQLGKCLSCLAVRSSQDRGAAGFGTPAGYPLDLLGSPDFRCLTKANTAYSKYVSVAVKERTRCQEAVETLAGGSVDLEPCATNSAELRLPTIDGALAKAEAMLDKSCAPSFPAFSPCSSGTGAQAIKGCMNDVHADDADMLFRAAHELPPSSVEPLHVFDGESATTQVVSLPTGFSVSQDPNGRFARVTFDTAGVAAWIAANGADDNAITAIAELLQMIEEMLQQPLPDLPGGPPCPCDGAPLSATGDECIISCRVTSEQRTETTNGEVTRSTRRIEIRDNTDGSSTVIKETTKTNADGSKTTTTTIIKKDGEGNTTSKTTEKRTSGGSSMSALRAGGQERFFSGACLHSCLDSFSQTLLGIDYQVVLDQWAAILDYSSIGFEDYATMIGEMQALIEDPDEDDGGQPKPPGHDNLPPMPTPQCLESGVVRGRNDFELGGASAVTYGSFVRP